MRKIAGLVATLIIFTLSFTSSAEPAQTTELPIVAIIGTGDMGDSLGPRFAELGYTVVFGFREPDGDKAQNAVKLTGKDARAVSQREAAAAGAIVVLTVPWPAMETVAQNLGDLSGKIVIDISFPHRQAEDGYY